MTTKTVKFIVFIILLVHGIGHFQGVAAGLGLKINNASPARSWLMKGFSQQANKTVCLFLFLVTGVMGIITAIMFKGIFLPDYWQLFALVTAVLSTACLILFPNGFAMFFNKIGAVAVNLMIYYMVFFDQKWPALLFEE